jgi:hypothetical protein
MANVVAERALTYLGFRTPSGADPGVPRSTLERIGVPGPDSSAAEVVIGIALLAVLVVAWVAIVVADTNLALRLLCAVAIAVDLLMVMARVRLLVERGTR